MIDTNPLSTSVLTARNNSSLYFQFFIKLVLFLIYLFQLKSSYNFCTFFILVVSIYTIYTESGCLTSFNTKIRTTQIVFENSNLSISLYTSLMSLTKIHDANFFVLFMIMIVMIFSTIFTINYRERHKKTILCSDVDNLASKETEMYIFELVSLANKQEDVKSRIKLIDFLNNHSVNCQDNECNCKRITLSFFIDPPKVQPAHSDINIFVNRQISKAVERSGCEQYLHIVYLYWQFYKMKNVWITYKLIPLLKSSKDQLLNFTLSKFLHEVECFMEDEEDKKQDLVNPYKFFRDYMNIYDFGMTLKRHAKTLEVLIRYLLCNLYNQDVLYNLFHELEQLELNIERKHNKIENIQSLYTNKIYTFHLIMVQNIKKAQEMRLLGQKSLPDFENKYLSALHNKEYYERNFAILIVSGDKADLFRVIETNYEVQGLLQYTSSSLINKNISLVMPYFIKAVHGKYLEELNSGKFTYPIKHVEETFVLDKNGFLTPVLISVKTLNFLLDDGLRYLVTLVPNKKYENKQFFLVEKESFKALGVNRSFYLSTGIDPKNIYENSSNYADQIAVRAFPALSNETLRAELLQAHTIECKMDLKYLKKDLKTHMATGDSDKPKDIKDLMKKLFKKLKEKFHDEVNINLVEELEYRHTISVCVLELTRSSSTTESMINFPTMNNEDRIDISLMTLDRLATQDIDRKKESCKKKRFATKSEINNSKKKITDFKGSIDYLRRYKLVFCWYFVLVIITMIMLISSFGISTQKVSNFKKIILEYYDSIHSVYFHKTLASDIGSIVMDIDIYGSNMEKFREFEDADQYFDFFKNTKLNYLYETISAFTNDKIVTMPDSYYLKSLYSNSTYNFYESTNDLGLVQVNKTVLDFYKTFISDAYVVNQSTLNDVKDQISSYVGSLMQIVNNMGDVIDGSVSDIISKLSMHFEDVIENHMLSLVKMQIIIKVTFIICLILMIILIQVQYNHSISMFTNFLSSKSSNMLTTLDRITYFISLINKKQTELSDFNTHMKNPLNRKTLNQSETIIELSENDNEGMEIKPKLEKNHKRIANREPKIDGKANAKEKEAVKDDYFDNESNNLLPIKKPQIKKNIASIKNNMKYKIAGLIGILIGVGEIFLSVKFETQLKEFLGFKVQQFKDMNYFVDIYSDLPNRLKRYVYRYSYPLLKEEIPKFTDISVEVRTNFVSFKRFSNNMFEKYGQSSVNLFFDNARELPCDIEKLTFYKDTFDDCNFIMARGIDFAFYRSMEGYFSWRRKALMSLETMKTNYFNDKNYIALTGLKESLSSYFTNFINTAIKDCSNYLKVFIIMELTNLLIVGVIVLVLFTSVIIFYVRKSIKLLNYKIGLLKIIQND